MTIGPPLPGLPDGAPLLEQLTRLIPPTQSAAARPTVRTTGFVMLANIFSTPPGVGDFRARCAPDSAEGESHDNYANLVPYRPGHRFGIGRKATDFRKGESDFRVAGLRSRDVPPTRQRASLALRDVSHCSQRECLPRRPVTHAMRRAIPLSANVRETDARSKFSVEGEQAKAARERI